MTTTRLIKFIFSLSALMLTGCVSFSQLSKEFSHSNLGDESVIVLGVEPRFRVHIFKGEDRADGWHRNNTAVTLNTFPENGYIVAKLAPRGDGQNYGIGGVLPDGIGGKIYSPCEGQETLTFNAPPGSVVYVGDFTFETDAGELGFRVSEDINKAKEFMSIHYPSFAEHLNSEGPSVEKLANVSCTTKVYIPVYF